MTEEVQPVATEDAEFYLPTLEDLFKLHTDDKLTEERAKFGTIPTGTYDLKIDEVELRPSESDKEFALKPETTPDARARAARPRAHLSVSLFQEGQPRGKIFFDVSWVDARGDKPRMDNKSGVYEDFKKHVVPEGKKMSVAEILKAAKNYTWKVKISELWKLNSLPDGHKEQIKTATSRELQVQYAKEGREAFNSVSRVWLPKQ